MTVMVRMVAGGYREYLDVEECCIKKDLPNILHIKRKDGSFFYSMEHVEYFEIINE